MVKKVSKKSKDKVSKKKESNSKRDDTKTFAFLATFLSMVGFIIALLVKQDDKYVMFYAKQSLLVFFVLFIGSVIMIVPIIGWIAGFVLQIIGLILWFYSWIYALSGEMKEVPLVGHYQEKFHF
jgi:uncharacterized membrane protein